MQLLFRSVTSKRQTRIRSGTRPRTSYTKFLEDSDDENDKKKPKSNILSTKPQPKVRKPAIQKTEKVSEYEKIRLNNIQKRKNLWEQLKTASKACSLEPKKVTTPQAPVSSNVDTSANSLISPVTVPYNVPTVTGSTNTVPTDTPVLTTFELPT